MDLDKLSADQTAALERLDECEVHALAAIRNKLSGRDAEVGYCFPSSTARSRRA
jgi:hypothetical protein